MGTLRKLYESMVNNPRAVRFEELDKLLRRAGFGVRQPGGGSSHYVYRKGSKKLVVPYHKPFVKEVYVRRAVELLEEAAVEEEDTE